MSRLLKANVSSIRTLGEKYNFIRQMLEKSAYTGTTRGVHGVKALYHWKNVLNEIRKLEGRASEFSLRVDELKAGQTNLTPTIILNLSKSKYV